jgi:DNA-binding XRE family transcriptional regulator
MSDEMLKPEEVIDKEKLIDILTEELPLLRAKIGVTQEELSDIVGISRPTYSAIETKKRRMSWNVYLSLLMVFTQNEKTAPMIELAGAFPDNLKKSLNISKR